MAASLLAGSASAGSASISYPDFSSINGLMLNGSASHPGTALRLASAAPLQHGSAWAQTPVDLTQSFESAFRADVHDGSFFPADGMTFAIQAQGLSALGDNGGAHGYAGVGAVSPSVAVDISVYPQSSQGANEQLSIVSGGNLLVPLAKATSPSLLYGKPFWAWVDYDAKAHSLQVFVSQTATKPAGSARLGRPRSRLRRRHVGVRRLHGRHRGPRRATSTCSRGP